MQTVSTSNGRKMKPGSATYKIIRLLDASENFDDLVEHLKDLYLDPQQRPHSGGAQVGELVIAEARRSHSNDESFGCKLVRHGCEARLVSQPRHRGRAAGPAPPRD